MSGSISPVAGELDRPGADQRLVEQVLVVLVGGDAAVELGLAPLVERRPALHPRRPLVRQLRDGVDPGADVLAAFGVVGRKRDHAVRPAPGRFLVQPVEGGQRGAEPRRLAAHLVQRDQPVVAVEGRVLDALGHDGAGVLLELHREAPHLAGAERVAPLLDDVGGEQLEDEVEDALVRAIAAPAGVGNRPFQVAVILGRGAVVVDVGAIDGEARHHLAQRLAQADQGVVAGLPARLGQAVVLVGENPELARELHVHDLLLRRVGDLLEGDAIADEALVGLFENRLGIGVHEQAVDQVQEIVAGGAGDRPFLAKPLMRSKDLLDDDVEGLVAVAAAAAAIVASPLAGPVARQGRAHRRTRGFLQTLEIAARVE